MSFRLSSAINVRSKPISSLRRASLLTKSQLAAMFSSLTLRSQPPKTGSQYPYLIDVVVVQLAVAAIGDVVHASDVYLRRLHDQLHLFHELRRRCVALHSQMVLGSVYRACGTHQFVARSRLADISRAQIKALAAEKYLDGVEILAAHNFNARDVTVQSWDELLHQSGVVNAEIQLSELHRLRQICFS